MTYYDLALAKVFTANRYYTYKSSESLPIGAVVEVPYGSKIITGIVINKVKKPTFATKEISFVTPHVLPKTTLQLLLWMHSFYIDDNGTITQLFLPPGQLTAKTRGSFSESIGTNSKLQVATDEQRAALKILKTAKKVLLHGETGSGKTRVFIEKAIEAIAAGQSVLILTPEIGLTSQLYLDLIKYTKASIVVSHSNLTNTQRKQIWLYAITNQRPTIYIGPRSALFLPIANIGLIVVDECHDSSYKQNQSPKYNALHIASQYAKLKNAQIVYSTATPNVDDYYKFKALNYKIIRLAYPAVGKFTHQLHIVDQANKNLFSSSYDLSDPLIAACRQALLNKQQILLFLNRRGSARLVQCNTCGYIFECPNCGIPLIYHHDHNLLMCHTCSYKIAGPRQCPSCHGVDLQYNIPGIKNLFTQISKMFPGAKIARFDTDVPKDKKVEQSIAQIQQGQIEIVVGTQMISKGLDMPKLSVVGVVNADSGLNLPDYSAEETTFQQLYQVTGRATRGYQSAHSYVQTRNPNHPIMQALVNRSWDEFYTYELAKRRQFKYPPFSYLAIIKTKAKTSTKALSLCNQLLKQLNSTGLQILGPSPSFFEKQNGYFVWQIVLKSPKRSTLNHAIANLKGNFSYDIDPAGLL